MIVCDWNRTLSEDAHESRFFIGLAIKVLLTYPNFFQPKKVSSILQTLVSVQKLHKDLTDLNPSKEDQGRLLKTIVDDLNLNIFKDVSGDLLHNFIKGFSRKACKRLDARLVSCLTRIHKDTGIPLVVISSGYGDVIEQTLRLAAFPFEMIVANKFEQRGGTLVGFRFDIYGNKEKIIQELLTARGLTTDETVFIGDDLQDERCFKMVKFPVVSFFADDTNRRFLIRQCNAFAPTSEDELRAFIYSG